jgi:hypothetical protein
VFVFHSYRLFTACPALADWLGHHQILQGVKAWEEAHGPFVYLVSTCAHELSKENNDDECDCMLCLCGAPQGGRYVERVIEQEESYEATRDQLRAARKKKDGKVDTVTPGKALPFM